MDVKTDCSLGCVAKRRKPQANLLYRFAVEKL